MLNIKMRSNAFFSIGSEHTTTFLKASVIMKSDWWYFILQVGRTDLEILLMTGEIWGTDERDVR